MSDRVPLLHRRHRTRRVWAWRSVSPHAGYPIIIGSRKQERADEAARTVLEAVPKGDVRGMENAAAVDAGSVIFITIPYNGQRPTLESLHEVIGDKIVINTVVPLAFEKGSAGAVHGPRGQLGGRRVAESCAQGAGRGGVPESERAGVDGPEPHGGRRRDRVQRRRGRQGDGDRVSPRRSRACAASTGGALENSRYVESITALLLNINRRYKGAHSMVKVSGV